MSDLYRQLTEKTMFIKIIIHIVVKTKTFFILIRIKQCITVSRFFFIEMFTRVNKLKTRINK